MKFKWFILLCYLFALVLLASSTEEVQTIKDEKTDADKAPKEYHVNDGYDGGGWGGYVGGDDWDGYGGGGGFDGYGGGGYRGGRGGGYGGGGWGGRGGGYGGGGWGGRGGGYGGGGWGGRGGGYGGGGWGGRGGGYGGGGGGWGGRGGGYGGGCRFGCCGRGFNNRGCSRCCRSLTEAIAFNEQEATP